MLVWSACLELVLVLEKDMERYLINRVKQRGGICLKFVSPGRAGVPDRIIVLPSGRVYFVEVKRPGEKPTNLQLNMLKELKSLGCEALWIDNKEAVDGIFT